MHKRLLVFVALGLLAACGADPDLTGEPDRLRVVTVDRPSPALEAKWGDQARVKLYARNTWRSVAVLNYVRSVAYAAAVERSEYARAHRASVRVAARQLDRPSRPVGTGGGSVWDSLSQCESGGRWDLNTGNGYFGGIQFSLTSWRAVGGSGYPHQNSREEQIARGERLRAIQGWGAWPACARKLGLI